ncbi:MAG: hypothetical protein PV344_05365, partial [Anaplasma sp.]|nr:hypothetical protein [Anaplasma sp.]
DLFKEKEKIRMLRQKGQRTYRWLHPFGSRCRYCKRLNFREDPIFANFANRRRFAKNRSREQFRQYVRATFDSRKLEPANN